MELIPPRVTLVVGPNGSGKSELLREILNWATSGQQAKVIESVECDAPDDPEEADHLLRVFESVPSSDNPLKTDQVWINQPLSASGAIDRAWDLLQLKKAVEKKDLKQVRELLVCLYVVRLDGRNRFSFVGPMSVGNRQQQNPTNLLWALLEREAERERIRELIHRVFGFYLVFDNATNQGSIPSVPTSMRHFPRP